MMNDRRGSRQADAGLCAACAHVQIITSSRGSTFYLCRLAAVDPRFPRYPRLPVLKCEGFRAAEDNLHAGARDGIEARVYWPGVGDVPVNELVLRRLLPLAHEGLKRYGVDPHARDRLLGYRRAPLRRGGQRRDVAGEDVPAALRGGAGWTAARTRCAR